jgi:signal transduction histidine kinase
VAFAKHGTSSVELLPESKELGELFSALGNATEALRQSHDELLTRVNDLEEELAQKNRALERKHRLEALGRIAAGVAHEIRNPLGSLSLYIDLLENEGAPSERACELLDRMRRSIGLLSSTVNDTLTFTEPGKAHAVPYDPPAILEEAIALALADRNGAITVCREFPPEARRAVGDPDWLGRIFLNLLRNACQAMRDGGRLTVRVAYGAQITVTIGDTGPGIDPEDLDKVFLPFWGKREGGTGLGLSIVHTLVERHQGQIELANGSDGGLEVSVTLPWELKTDSE